MCLGRWSSKTNRSDIAGKMLLNVSECLFCLMVASISRHSFGYIMDAVPVVGFDPTWSVTYSMLFVPESYPRSQALRPPPFPATHKQNWTASNHYDVIKWKQFLRYSPFVKGIYRSPVDSPHKDQWRGALMFSLICGRTTIEQTSETLVIWDAIGLIMTSL